jgi:hypothetical protein
VKAQGKIGVSGVNHDETLVRVQKPAQGLKVKTKIKAGRALHQPQPSDEAALA